MNEMDLLNSCRLSLQAMGYKTFRINVGKVKTADGRYFNAGPCVGFSDLLAISPDGQAAFIETKMHPRKPTQEQIKFLLAMIKQNCKAGVAYTVEDAIKIAKWEDNTQDSMVDYLTRLLK